MKSVDVLSERRPVGRARRWAMAAAGGVAVALAGGGAVVAVAGTPAVFRQSNGVVAVDAAQLTHYAYEGHRITTAQKDQLNAAGKAKLSLVTREGACQGDILLFDTEDQLIAFNEASLAKRAAAGDSPTQDPCGVAAEVASPKAARH